MGSVLAAIAAAVGAGAGRGRRFSILCYAVLANTKMGTDEAGGRTVCLVASTSTQLTAALQSGHEGRCPNQVTRHR